MSSHMDVLIAERDENPDQSSQSNLNVEEKFVKEFEKQMTQMRHLGLIAVGMHKFSVFLRACALTWASVLILAYASHVRERDVKYTTILLLLEAVHIVWRGFFVELFTTSLKELTFSRRDLDRKRNLILFSLRLLAALLVCLFTVPSLVLSVIGRSDLHKYPPNEDFAFRNLTKFSLEVFYVLVIANTAVGVFADYIYHAGVLFVAGSRSRIVETGYYDAVVSKGIREGILEANALSVFEFAYPFQSMDYLRRVHAMVVLEQSRDLIRYLFCTKEGMEYTTLALGSDDPYKQLAAANIVGLWVVIPVQPTLDCTRLRLHTHLLPKLADKLGSRLLGRAAAYSFFFLGIKHPDMVVNVHSLIQCKNVVDILLDLIFIDNPTFSSCYVRALIPLIDTLRVERWQTSDSRRHEKLALEVRLNKLVRKPGLRLRQRVTVAYALFKLCDDTLSDDVKQYLSESRPVRDDVKEFWREREKEWLKNMLGEIPQGAGYEPVIIPNDSIAPVQFF